ncbi:MAG TPA: HDOD domain-containing protein, partial [Ignavibacteriaceae bacterium]
MKSLTDNLLNKDQLENVLSKIVIPDCPSMVSEALKEAQKDDPDLRKLSHLISENAAMSAAALKLANSPLFKGRDKISGVKQAVERLGTRISICIVFEVSLRATGNGLPPEWLEQFWKRTMQTATVAALIAKKQFGVAPDAAYTYALFHDAAIPIMMKRFKEYEGILEKAKENKIMLVEAENSYFPCTHPVVGSLIVKNWGLPPLL